MKVFAGLDLSGEGRGGVGHDLAWHINYIGKKPALCNGGFMNESLCHSP